MSFIRLALLFLWSAFLYGADPLIDLEFMSQDFVIETKQLNIPQYQDAFNPSIIRWGDSLLLSFRARDPKTGTTSLVGLVWLDENFEPVSDPSLLIFHHDELSGNAVQDPRLLVVQGQLYMVYSNTWKLPNQELRRVFISSVEYDGTTFTVRHPEVFLHFEGDKNNKFEKNWVPFEYNGDLLLSYSINPHKVFLPIFGTKKCLTVAWSEIETDWDWGILRGGTQAQLVDGQYLSFFHSSKLMRTTHSDGKLIPHYFMGAYTFDAQPPFKVQKISPEIIVGKNFYHGPNYKTWKPLRVVFPCGFVFDDANIWVAYGRQDHEIWIAKFDKKKLLASLVPVQNK